MAQYFIDPEKLPGKTLAPGVQLRVAWGQHLMFSFVRLEAAVWFRFTATRTSRAASAWKGPWSSPSATRPASYGAGGVDDPGWRHARGPRARRGCSGAGRLFTRPSGAMMVMGGSSRGSWNGRVGQIEHRAVRGRMDNTEHAVRGPLTCASEPL